MAGQTFTQNTGAIGDGYENKVKQLKKKGWRDKTIEKLEEDAKSEVSE